MLEQWYMDELNPSLNILKTAMSSLGHIQSPETRMKLMLSNSNRIEVQVTDITRDKVDVYQSLRAAARALKTSINSIRYVLTRGTIFRGRLKIIKLNN